MAKSLGISAYNCKAQTPSPLRHYAQMPNRDLRTKLGANVQRLRKERGLSQTEVAARSKAIDQTTVGRIERGAIATTIDVLPALARVLGVSIGELIGEAATAAETPNRVEEPLATYGAEVASPALVRELIAGVLGPLGLQLLGEIEIDEDGVRLAAQWRKTPQERRRGIKLAANAEEEAPIELIGKLTHQPTLKRKAHAQKGKRA
jgi:transcriptional regulator with XRE-family HTH domain